MNKLSFKHTILVASMLFGMFFGAGNLIFPVHLGQLAGSNVWPALIGFVITGVGIPILGVAAIGMSHSDGLQSLADRVGKGYGYFFTCALYLTIGPFFAIPRCATTSFTTGISPMLASEGSAAAVQLLFTLLFFAVVLFFSLKPSGIMNWIGRFINPVFLIFLAILIIAAFIHPAASVASVAPEAGYESNAFFNGFIEGYGTMDAIAGLAFGIIVINVIRGLGITGDDHVAKSTLKAGLFTGILMAVIYILTIIMGTQSRGLFETSANGGIALAQISGHYLGRAGSVVLACTITFACLKTAIGLVTSCSETFVKMFPKALNYRLWAILFTAFSFLVSNIGLTAIISYSIPVLMLLYPLAITLILLALFGRFFEYDRRIFVSVTAFTLAAALFDFFKTLPQGLQTALRLDAAVNAASRMLPFFSLGLGWIVPALIGLILGIILRKTSR